MSKELGWLYSISPPPERRNGRDGGGRLERPLLRGGAARGDAAEERIKTQEDGDHGGKTTPHLAIPSKTMITPAKEVSALRKRALPEGEPSSHQGHRPGRHTDGILTEEGGLVRYQGRGSRRT